MSSKATTGTILIELQYLPPLAFFTAISNAQRVHLERHEHYAKQTYRNRCYINTASGVRALTIPVVSAHSKVVVTGVRIDYRQKWLKNHWRSIESAYGNAPFFEYYCEDLHRTLFTQFEFLYDLNFALLTLCLKMLKSDLTIVETMAYEKNPTNDLIDLRTAINPKNPEKLQSVYRSTPYYQVFGNKFVENLSIIDLIFCEGPGAARVVQASSPN